jgi:thiamine-monophosphate kinase
MPITRAGARPGDEVYVTGLLGNSFESGRHLTFEPRVEDALWLRATLGADLTSMIDVSDGLGRDGARIARASGVCVRIDARALPLHADATNWLHAAGEGEDYEMLFTSARGLGSSIRSAGGTPITRIGRVVAVGACSPTPACVFETPEGAVIDGSELGWDHG